MIKVNHNQRNYEIYFYLVDATYFIPRNEDFSTAGVERKEAWKSVIKSLDSKLNEIYPPEKSGWSWKYVDERAAEIREYQDRHPEITSFVSLDDRNWEKGLLGRFIWTNNHISEEDMKNCIRLLNI